jgi:membrane fusion protein, heavy metal efflux system
MTILRWLRLVLWLDLLATIPSCSKAPAKHTTAKTDEQQGPQETPAATAKKPTDLDRSIDDLFAVTCEHGRKTFACDECRYEVGVVRAPVALTQGGLVKVVKAEKHKLAVPITLTGEIRFDERRVGHVSSQVEGVIKKVHVALGDRVKTGQPLMEIESVAIGDAQASSLEAEAMLDLARKNFERASELRRQSISSEKEYLQAKNERDATEIRARGARAKLTRLGTSGTRGRLMLRAPMDGTVLMMHAVSGEVAKTEQSLVTVGDSSTVWVWADLYERDLAAVMREQAAAKLSAAVTVKAYQGEDFPGVVDLVSPAMDESSRTIKVRIAVKNPDGRLLAGMFASITLFLPGTEEALAVPKDAVLTDEGRSFVFIHHHDDYYVRRPVVTGRSWAGLVEIKQGLVPSQVVVTEGAFLMKSDILRSKMGAGCAD